MLESWKTRQKIGKQNQRRDTLKLERHKKIQEINDRRNSFKKFYYKCEKIKIESRKEKQKACEDILLRNILKEKIVIWKLHKYRIKIVELS